MELSPTLRPSSLKGSLLSQIPLFLSMGLGALVAPNPAVGMIVGAAVFLTWRMVIVREVVCRDHRRGLRLAREGSYEEALLALRASEEFWMRHAAVDRLRWLLLGSAGPYSFLTLSQYNQACCLVQLKRPGAAFEVLGHVLTLAPGMPEARELRAELEEESLRDESTWDDPKSADRTWSFEDLFPNVRDET